MKLTRTRWDGEENTSTNGFSCKHFFRSFFHPSESLRLSLCLFVFFFCRVQIDCFVTTNGIRLLTFDSVLVGSVDAIEMRRAFILFDGRTCCVWLLSTVLFSRYRFCPFSSERTHNKMKSCGISFVSTVFFFIILLTRPRLHSRFVWLLFWKDVDVMDAILVCFGRQYFFLPERWTEPHEFSGTPQVIFLSTSNETDSHTNRIEVEVRTGNSIKRIIFFDWIKTFAPKIFAPKIVFNFQK